PSVYLEQVRIDGNLFASRDSHSPLLARTHASLVNLGANSVLRIEPKHRKIDFDFTALSFTAPENVHFRYRLDGIDNDWVDAGKDRTVSYSRLGAEDYRFRVIACNN